MLLVLNRGKIGLFSIQALLEKEALKEYVSVLLLSIQLTLSCKPHLDQKKYLE